MISEAHLTLVLLSIERQPLTSVPVISHKLDCELLCGKVSEMEAEHKRLIIAQCPRPFLTGQICCCWKTEIVCWGKQTHRKGLLLQSIILERLSLIFYCKRHFFVKFGIMIKEWIILKWDFFFLWCFSRASLSLLDSEWHASLAPDSSLTHKQISLRVVTMCVAGLCSAFVL